MGLDAHLSDAVHRAAGLADIVKLSEDDLDLPSRPPQPAGAPRLDQDLLDLQPVGEEFEELLDAPQPRGEVGQRHEGSLVEGMRAHRLH